jgi:hypothetical protein
VTDAAIPEPHAPAPNLPGGGQHRPACGTWSRRSVQRWPTVPGRKPCLRLGLAPSPPDAPGVLGRERCRASNPKGRHGAPPVAVANSRVLGDNGEVEEPMGVCGGIARPVLHWVTALLALVAGLPHWECHCSGGRPVLFCPGQARGTAAPASHASCCSSAPETGCRHCCPHSTSTGPRRNHGCCEERYVRRGPGESAGIRCPGCKKAFTQAQAVTSSSSQTDTRGLDESLGGLPALQAARVLPALVQAPGRAYLPVHLLAPPPDLAVLLLHLLI